MTAPDIGGPIVIMDAKEYYRPQIEAAAFTFYGFLITSVFVACLVCVPLAYSAGVDFGAWVSQSAVIFANNNSGWWHL